MGVSGDEAPAEPEAEPKFGVRVVVLSDLAQSSFQTAADLSVPGTTQQATLEVVDVLDDVETDGRGNRAITAIEAVHVPGATPRTIEVRARLQSFAKEQADGEPEPVDVTLKQADRDLSLGAADIVAGTIVDKVLQHSFEAAGVHPVSVTVESDALAEDDERYLKVEVRRQVRTLVVDGAPSGVPKEDEVFYLERALLAGAADQPPPRIIGADDLPRADLSAYDVLVLAGVDVFSRQEGSRLTQFVEGGGGLLITMSASLDAELYNAELDRMLPRRLRGLKQAASGDRSVIELAAPTSGDLITQIFSGEALGGLLSTRTSSYWLLQPATEPEMDIHLRFADGQPALVSRTFGSGRVALLATSIDRDMTDLPIRPAFVPLIRQIVLYLGRALDTPDRRRTLIGQTRQIKVPRGAQELMVVAPDGRETRWNSSSLDAGVVAFDGTELPGHYQVSAAFAGAMEIVGSETFAVNVDTRESDLKPLSIGEAQAILKGQARQAEGATRVASASIGQRLDPEALAAILLAIMAIAFVAESGLSALR